MGGQAANAIGAVNTIIVDEDPLTGRKLLRGENTDWIGISMPIQRRLKTVGKDKYIKNVDFVKVNSDFHRYRSSKAQDKKPVEDNEGVENTPTDTALSSNSETAEVSTDAISRNSDSDISASLDVDKKSAAYIEE